MKDEDVEIIRALIVSGRVSYGNEDELQQLIEKRLASLQPGVDREFRLSDHDRLDFFWESRGIVLEVKIKGNYAQHYQQLERYAQDPRVKGIILIRTRGKPLPEELNNKPVRVINLWPYLL